MLSSIQNVKSKLLVEKTIPLITLLSLQGLPTTGALLFCWWIMQQRSKFPYGLETKTIFWGSMDSQFQCFTSIFLSLLALKAWFRMLSTFTFFLFDLRVKYFVFELQKWQTKWPFKPFQTKFPNCMKWVLCSGLLQYDNTHVCVPAHSVH